jgi:SOS-response transcriptional repressor LexA
MNLGSKVKAARQRKGWEIADLARASGVDLKTIAAIEKRDSVRSQFAQQLAAALGVPVDEILSDGEYIFEALDRHKEGMRESLAFLGEPVARMVPLISWVRATDFDEAFDPYAPGDAEDWIPAPKRAGRHAYALRVRGDSMFNPGGPKSYPEGSVIVVDPEKRSPVSGDLVIAKIDGAPEVTFKRYRNEDGRQWLQPLNPTFPRIDDPFKVLGTVLGKWEDA